MKMEHYKKKKCIDAQHKAHKNSIYILFFLTFHTWIKKKKRTIVKKCKLLMPAF